MSSKVLIKTVNYVGLQLNATMSDLAFFGGQIGPKWDKSGNF